MPNIEEARQELMFETLHKPFREIYNLEEVNVLATNVRKKKKFDEYWKDRDDKFSAFYEQIFLYSGNQSDVSKEEIVKELTCQVKLLIKSLKEMVEMDIGFSEPFREYQLIQFIPKTVIEWGVIFAWILLHKIGTSDEKENIHLVSRARIDEWLLGRVLERQIEEFPIIKGDLDPENCDGLVKILIFHQNWYKTDSELNPVIMMRKMLSNPEVHDFLAINRYQEVLWFNSERFLFLIRSLLLIALITTISENQDPFLLPKELQPILKAYQAWYNGYTSSDFQIEKLLNQIQSEFM